MHATSTDSPEPADETKATLARLINKCHELQERNAIIETENAQLTATHKATVARTYRKRPAVMRGRTVQTNVGCGPLYVTLNEDETGKPFEVFFKLGKSGSCQQSYLEALGVAISIGLRYGAEPQKFVDKFRHMRCPIPKMRTADSPATLSCPDAISQGLSRALDLVLLDEHALPTDSATATPAVSEPTPLFPTLTDITTHEATFKALSTDGLASGMGMCPKCNGPLVYQSGCTVCLSQCGYEGKCG